jgi:hypothetical protein
VKQISKAQRAQKEVYLKDLRLAYENLYDAVNEYNVLVGEVNAFAAEVAREMQDYFDERSEAWQASDKADEFASWMSAWDTLEIEEADIPEGIYEFEELTDSIDD